MSEHCLKEKEWGLIEATLKAIRDSQDRTESRVATHIETGEGKGGYRERIIILEQRQAQLERDLWARTIVAGIIGGLIGNVAPEVLSTFVHWLSIK